MWNGGNIVCVLPIPGHHDQAIDRLAVHLETTEGFSSWALQLDPAWDFMCDNERFNGLVAASQNREAML